MWLISLTVNFLHKKCEFVFGIFSKKLFLVFAGSEIAFSWLPMQLKILHWQPEYSNCLPAGN